MNKKTKKTILEILGITAFISAVLTIVPALAPLALAQFAPLQQIGSDTGLPGGLAEHAKSSAVAGASEITSVIYKVMDVIKYFAGSVAVAMLVFSGVRLVTAGKDIEKISESQKKNIGYSIAALIVIIVADTLVKNIFFGEAGNVLENQEIAKQYAGQGSQFVEGVYGFMMKFVGVVAVVVVIGSGIGITLSSGSEDKIKNHQNRIMWAMGGLIVAGIGEYVIKDIIFPKAGQVLPDIEKAKKLLVNFTNFISGFISTIAVVLILYAGFLYVTAVDNEENTKKAQKIILGAVIGIVLSMGAYALVNTVVTFKRDIPSFTPIGAAPAGFGTLQSPVESTKK